MDEFHLSLSEAVQILGLGPEASAEARHRLFQKKSVLLERKLRFAPTAGLRARYRLSLEQLTRAFETVELAATAEDLSEISPEADLPAGSSVELSAGERAVVSGRVQTPTAFGLFGPGRPGRLPLRLDLWIAPLAVFAMLVAGGLWWWKAEQAKSEMIRLAEVARLESARAAAEAAAAARAQEDQQAKRDAAAERQRLESERLAAAQQALVQQRETERRAALDRQVGIRLAEVESQFEAESRRLSAVELGISELRTRERELDAQGGWALEWTRQRRSRLEPYRQWLVEFMIQHPARIRLRTAGQLLLAGDPDAAALEAQAVVDLWTLHAEEPRNRRHREVGRPLVETAVASADWPPEAYAQVRKDEPEAVDRFLEELRRDLSYLDEPGKEALPADWRTRMLPLSLLAGHGDRDFQRWQPRFISTLTLRTHPAGALLADESGNTLGPAPQSLQRVRGTKMKLSATLPGYLPATVEATVGTGETQVVQIELTEIPVPKVGQTFTVPDLGLVLRWIEPGRFDLGSPTQEAGRTPEEGPQIPVRLSQGYWLGQYEVTQREWSILMGRNPSAFKEVGPEAPVESVSWKDALDFGRRLTERERVAGRLPAGLAYTLPTEAQWEYACRAGTTGPYSGPLDSVAWHGIPRGGSTRPVGQKAPNAWGLYDMHGNVWEWCLDWYADGYKPHPTGDVVIDPQGPKTGSYRINRGGSWRSPALNCRSAFRHWLAPNDRGNGLGFRLALVQSGPPDF